MAGRFYRVKGQNSGLSLQKDRSDLAAILIILESVTHLLNCNSCLLMTCSQPEHNSLEPD